MLRRAKYAAERVQSFAALRPMPNANRKQQAHALIDKLPDNATWDDLMRELYEHQAIERGLVDSDAGRGDDVKTVRAKYGQPE